MFFYLCKVLFSGFLQFNGNFVDGQNNSEYLDRHGAPLIRYAYFVSFEKDKIQLVCIAIHAVRMGLSFGKFLITWKVSAWF